MEGRPQYFVRYNYVVCCMNYENLLIYLSSIGLYFDFSLPQSHYGNVHFGCAGKQTPLLVYYSVSLIKYAKFVDVCGKIIIIIIIFNSRPDILVITH